MSISGKPSRGDGEKPSKEYARSTKEAPLYSADADKEVSTTYKLNGWQTGAKRVSLIIQRYPFPFIRSFHLHKYLEKH